MVDKGFGASGCLWDGEDLYGRESARERGRRVWGATGLASDIHTTEGSEFGTGERGHDAHLHEHLLDEAPVRRLVERLVKHDYRSASPEAVACHLELVHGVGVEQLEADRGSVWGEGGPQVEVRMATGFEEEGRGAVGEICEFVQESELVLCV